MRKKVTAKPVNCGMQIEFLFNRQVTFECSSGVEILEYDTETVRIGNGKCRVRIFGQELLLKKIAPLSVMVQGKISSLEFE